MIYRQGKRCKTRKRKKDRRGFFRGLAVLALVTLALKLFLQSPVAQSLEDAIARNAGEGSLAAAALSFELGVSPEVSAQENNDENAGDTQESASAVQADNSGDQGEAAPDNSTGEDAGTDNAEAAGDTKPEDTGEKPALVYDAGLIGLTNHTSMDIDVASYLAQDLDLNISADGPAVLIIHTHTSEAYTPTEENNYVPSDPYRTEDPNYSVVRAGNVVQKTLEDAGIGVIHDTNLYDYPSYNGCYNRALSAIEDYLAEYPTISVVLDIHRDSIQTADGKEYSTVANINGEKSAQVMLVVGTNEGGLSHPDWEKNFRFALELQTVMMNRYPGLARDIDLRKERFNEHATTGSLLVEFGYSGNTLEEALAAANYFSDCLTETLTEKK